jgi:hypothetical protein
VPGYTKFGFCTSSAEQGRGAHMYNVVLGKRQAFVRRGRGGYNGSARVLDRGGYPRMAGQLTRMRTIPGVGAQIVDVQWYVVLATVRTGTRCPGRLTLYCNNGKCHTIHRWLWQCSCIPCLPNFHKTIKFFRHIHPFFHVRKISSGYGTVQKM